MKSRLPLVVLVLIFVSVATQGFPTICTTIFEPVCGSDGVMYANECLAQANNISSFSKGPCDGLPGPVCGSDGITYDNESLALAKNVSYTVGTCAHQPFGCPKIYAPVCGSDGFTYANECLAQQSKNVSSFTQGVCENEKQQPPIACPLIYAPVCGSDGFTYANECLALSNNIQFTSGPCIDRGPPADCPKIYQPVCTSNGKTYDNECLAEVANFTSCQLTAGPCPDSS